MSGRRRQRSQGSPLDFLAHAERVARAAEADAYVTTVDDGEPLLDARGYPRPDQTTSGWKRGRIPANKGRDYGPNPPTVAECMAMLRCCPPDLYGRRLYAAIILMWQGALRARCEALRLVADDLDPATGTIRIRHGKNDKAATITMAAWVWPFLEEWLTLRRDLAAPDGAVLCVIDGPTAGRPWGYSDLNRSLKRVAAAAGITKRLSCHQLRHAWAAHAYLADTDLRTIQLHLRHENIGVTDTYLQGLGLGGSRELVYRQAVPMVPATALLELVGGRP